MPDDPASFADARQLAEHHYYAALDLVLEGHHEQAVEEYRLAVAADAKFTDRAARTEPGAARPQPLRRSDRGV